MEAAKGRICRILIFGWGPAADCLRGIFEMLGISGPGEGAWRSREAETRCMGSLQKLMWAGIRIFACLDYVLRRAVGAGAGNSRVGGGEVWSGGWWRPEKRKKKLKRKAVGGLGGGFLLVRGGRGPLCVKKRELFAPAPPKLKGSGAPE